MSEVTYTIGEKVETIVMSYLRTGAAGGHFGCIVRINSDTYRVETEGYTFIVRTAISPRWVVFFKGTEKWDDDLELAAQRAWDDGKKFNASRNYPVEVAA